MHVGACTSTDCLSCAWSWQSARRQGLGSSAAAMADDYVDDGAEEEMVDDEPLTEDDDMQQDDDAASQETQDAPEIEEEVRTEGSRVCMAHARWPCTSWRHSGIAKTSMATAMLRAHARCACCQDEEVLASPSKRAIAQAERERLRAMAKNKKELLKSMKQQEHSNAAAAAGEVGTVRTGWLSSCAHVPPRSFHSSLAGRASAQ